MNQRRVLVVVALVVLAVGLFVGRKTLIRAFFFDGPPEAAPALTRPPGSVGLPDPVQRLRVVLVDGLSASAAHTLPHLGEQCRRGLDLFVDNGFPTVSLPVQHVLWTGRTQQQSGIQYRIAGLQVPPRHGLPTRVPGSVAVAESHGEIVGSFGFSAVEGPPEVGVERDRFVERARAAVAGDARLVFVHILAVDEAGHAEGRGSQAYRDAATFADDVIDAVVAADAGVHEETSTWLVLSDHGHREDGGHGGAEPEIRHVRACLWGAGIDEETLPPGRSLHLVDLSRALFDLLGMAPGTEATGRPLAWALAHPDPDATLPRAGGGRIALFWALVVGAGLVTGRVSGGAGRWPWWAAVAYLGVVIAHGLPTLSVPAVYPPLGRDLLLAAGAGLAVAVGQATVLGGPRPGSTAAALLILPLSVAVGLVLLVAGRPPLLPRLTADASVWLTVCWSGALAIAVGLTLAAVHTRRRGADR